MRWITRDSTWFLFDAMMATLVVLAWLNMPAIPG